MEKTLESAGNLLAKVGYRAQLLLLGVLLPGALITMELSAIWAFDDPQRREWALKWVTQDMAHLAIPSLVVLGIALLFVAYVFGYIARDFTFKLSSAWLRRGWPPNRSVATILAQLRLVHGAPEVDRIIARYPVFSLTSDAATASLPRPPDFYVREYCKLWLRTRAPALTTDGMEAEINMVIGFVIPVLLGIIPSIVFLPALFGHTTAALAAAAFAVFAFRLFYNISAVRCQETEEAIRNFLFAHSMRLDTPPRPPRG